MRAWLDPLQKAIKNDENKAIDIQEKMQAKRFRQREYRPKQSRQIRNDRYPQPSA